MAEAVSSYLQHYAEHEVGLAESIEPEPHEFCLVVPAYDEPEHLVARLLGNQKDSILLILVVNSPESGHARTLRLIRQVAKLPRSAACDHLSVHRFRQNQQVLLVDRASADHTIAPRQGVGLARKIGADIATSLIRRGCIDCPMIFNTDADVQLPGDYFQHGRYSRDAALLYPYVHLAEPGLETQAALYDLSLDYYVEGLRIAGSPYAFQTIGSTLAVHHEAYARVRGFPKRAAAEDFYLLNKLAKVGDVVELDHPIIQIQARSSQRTPFGTGQALRRLCALDVPLRDVLFYNPKIFSSLHFWLDHWSVIWTAPPGDFSELFRNAGEYSTALQAYIHTHELDAVIARGLGQYRSQQAFLKYLTQWFDAFRTLKFVHYMRDNHFPSVSLETLSELLGSMDFSQSVMTKIETLLNSGTAGHPD